MLTLIILLESIFGVNMLSYSWYVRILNCQSFCQHFAKSTPFIQPTNAQSHHIGYSIVYIDVCVCGCVFFVYWSEQNLPRVWLNRRMIKYKLWPFRLFQKFSFEFFFIFRMEKSTFQNVCCHITWISNFMQTKKKHCVLYTFCWVFFFLKKFQHFLQSFVVC